jgi:hypothetical protein
LRRGDNLSRGHFCRRSHFVVGGVFGDRNLLWGSVNAARYDRRLWSTLARSMTAPSLRSKPQGEFHGNEHMFNLAILVANFNLEGWRF